jgi:putative flippase GtrA
MIKSLLKMEINRQFFKFCIIGLESTVLTYLIFIILFYYLSVNYLLSAGTGFVAGVFLGFAFNKIYTFRSRRKSAVAAPQYFIVYLISLMFNMLSLRFLVENLSIYPLLSNILILPFVVLINFFGTKLFVFKNREW